MTLLGLSKYSQAFQNLPLTKFCDMSMSPPGPKYVIPWSNFLLGKSQVQYNTMHFHKHIIFWKTSTTPHEICLFVVFFSTSKFCKDLLNNVVAIVLLYTHTHTCTRVNTHTHTLSLSFSLTYTHTHISMTFPDLHSVSRYHILRLLKSLIPAYLKIELILFFGSWNLKKLRKTLRRTRGLGARTMRRISASEPGDRASVISNTCPIQIFTLLQNKQLQQRKKISIT